MVSKSIPKPETHNASNKKSNYDSTTFDPSPSNRPRYSNSDNINIYSVIQCTVVYNMLHNTFRIHPAIADPWYKKAYEPQRQETYLGTFAPNEDSNQLNIRAV